MKRERERESSRISSPSACLTYDQLKQNVKSQPTYRESLIEGPRSLSKQVRYFRENSPERCKRTVQEYKVAGGESIVEAAYKDFSCNNAKPNFMRRSNVSPR
jgi:hypothetical protein